MRHMSADRIATPEALAELAETTSLERAALIRLALFMKEEERRTGFEQGVGVWGEDVIARFSPLGLVRALLDP